MRKLAKVRGNLLFKFLKGGDIAEFNDVVVEINNNSFTKQLSRMADMILVKIG